MGRWLFFALLFLTWLADDAFSIQALHRFLTGTALWVTLTRRTLMSSLLALPTGAGSTRYTLRGEPFFLNKRSSLFLLSTGLGRGGW